MINDTSPLLSRRGALGLGAGLLAATVPGSAAVAAGKSFAFVHFTDPHIQPELGAARGVRKAFAAVRALPEKPAFVLMGGDIVMDANQVSHDRADMLYDMWRTEASALQIPFHYSVGNHDLFNIGTPNADPKTMDAGKALWKRRLGLHNPYTTFDFGGWRFVMLDSVGINAGGAAEGFVDDAQIVWLDNLLRKTPRTMPLVLLTHYPLMTLFAQYTEASTAGLPPGLVVKNGKTVQEMLQKHHVKAVFQGHTHVVEDCAYLGTRYITGGAVSGDWWKGKRLGVHPEGFGVVRAGADGDLSYRYVPYGWTPVGETK